MSAEARDGWVEYASRRRRADAEFCGRYRPIRAVRLRERGSLEHWLTERYCLYLVHAGRVYCAEIHHQQWPLRDAEAELEINTVTAAAGIRLPQDGPMVHYAEKLEVLIWPLRVVG